MTSAPLCLRQSRAEFISHFDVHPGRTVDADLDPAEVGIVPDKAHRDTGGYHCGEDDLRAAGRVGRDYSVIESARDRGGLTDDACAIDIGWFSRTFANGVHVDLRHWSNWLVAQCQAGAPDTLDIREIIYSPDGKVVRRYDRLGRRTGGDDSHLFHTHLSLFRDAVRAGRGLVPVIRRYVATFSGAAVPLEDDDMTPMQDARLANLYGWTETEIGEQRKFRAEQRAANAAETTRDAAMLAAMNAIAAGRLNPQEIVAAVREEGEKTRETAAELYTRIGELEAELEARGGVDVDDLARRIVHLLIADPGNPITEAQTELFTAAVLKAFETVRFTTGARELPAA